MSRAPNNLAILLLLLTVALGCSGQGMFSIPTTCDRASCTVYVQWSPMGSDTIRFELEGTAEGWVAVGVSADQVMGGDGIDDVFVCQRASGDDTVTAEDAYNPQNQSPRANNRDSNQNGFQQISASYSSGRISCSFDRSVLPDNVAEDRNLNESVYLLLAAGSERGSALTMYHDTGRMASNDQMMLINPVPVPTATMSPMATIGTPMTTNVQSPMASSTPFPMAPGMFSIPTTCDRASCTVYVQWSPMGSDTIRFELEGTAEGWVAVGVSADRVMGGDGIDDVFVCQRASGDDTVTAEDAYNPQNQSPRANNRDSNQNGFQQISASYSSGRISCSFDRSVLPDNVAEDRNLNESVYLLLAAGSERGSALTMYHGSVRVASADQMMLINPAPAPTATMSPMATTATPMTTNAQSPMVTNTPSPMTSGMFSIPTTCDRASCTVYVQWAPIGSDTIRFEMEGAAEGWVAVGVSADRVMGGDGIDDVFVCQRASGDDTVTARDAYNPQNQSPRANNRDSNQNGFQQISTSYSSGRISCTFTRSILADNVNEDRNLNETAFILLAAGTQTGSALTMYHGSVRVASADQMMLTNPAPAPTATPSPMTPGTFRIPNGCSRESCDVYAQWRVMGSDSITFELEGRETGWVAIGVSADQRMGVDGIDDVFACQRDATTDVVYAQDTFNPQNQARRGNMPDTNQTGFQLVTSSFTNGRISCSFIRSIRTGNMAEDRDLDVPAFLLLASGSETGGPNVTLALHQMRGASDARVDLLSGQGAVSACLANPFIRVHGIFMYLAWVWLVPTAYFFAANMKPAMPTGKWFQIHRALMLIAIVPSVLGFILIFVAFRGNSQPGLIVLGSLNPTGTTHFVFGLIIILLQFTNPIISFCRCKPDGKFRWIFNLIHGFIVGYGVIILALINVGIGIWQYSTYAYDQTSSSRYYPFWIWIVFIIVFSIWDTFLYVYSKWIYPRLDKKFKKTGEHELDMKPVPPAKPDENEIELKTSLTTKPDDKEDPPKKEPSKDATLRYGFLIFNTFLLVVPGLVIMLLIAIGCI